MGRFDERLKVALSRVHGGRDKLLVSLAFAFPSRPSADLASMTATGALAELKGRRDLAARLVIRLIERLRLKGSSLLFASRKGRGTRPAHRVTIWRVLHKALGGGFRLLRRLVANIGSLMQPIVKPKPRPAPAIELPDRLTAADLMRLSSVPSG